MPHCHTLGIGPGGWDCSQLAKTQIIAVGLESVRARIVAEQFGTMARQHLFLVDCDIEYVVKCACIAFHYARKVIV